MNDNTAKDNKKSSRRIARELAMQGLYQWRMSGNSIPMVEEHLAHEAEDYPRADRPLLITLLRGASDNVEALEAEFLPFLDRPADEISPIERSILLLATYEFAHRLETPYRVVMNEAIELAKEFGGTDGHRFVNGVLDKLAVRLRKVEVEHAAKQRGK
ncbi:MAG: transcription antitermination factor NusB [Rhodocyclaceae bacterium]